MNQFPYKGDWRVKEYKAYTEKLEDYVALLDELVDLLREELASKEEHYYRLKPFVRDERAVVPRRAAQPLRRCRDEWGHTSTDLWP